MFYGLMTIVYAILVVLVGCFTMYKLGQFLANCAKRKAKLDAQSLQLDKRINSLQQEALVVGPLFSSIGESAFCRLPP